MKTPPNWNANGNGMPVVPPGFIDKSGKVVQPSKSKNTITEYVVIPVLLMIVFIILVHPKTSGMLEKYIPKMTSMKGYLVRAFILAIMYIIIRAATSMMNK